MGCWGMGLTQSDQFMEAYEAFMEEYDAGGEPAAIRDRILDDYRKEFADDDPILHDVWFALAKAEWMCCAQSKMVLDRVWEIIESEENLAFYRELEASDRDLAARKRNLDKFWRTLSTPRQKPRKRRPPAKEKVLPPLNAGDVIAYPVEGGRRVAVVLDVLDCVKEEYLGPHVFCGILKRIFSREELKTLEPLREELGWIGFYDADEFLAPSSIRTIGQVSMPEKLYARFFLEWHKVVIISGKRQDFRADHFLAEGYLLQDLLNEQGKLPKEIKRVRGWQVTS